VVSTDPIDVLFGSGQPASELDSMPAMTFQTISPMGIMITPIQKTIGWASTTPRVPTMKASVMIAHQASGSRCGSVRRGISARIVSR